MNESLLASAFSELLGSKVISHEAYKLMQNEVPYNPLCIDDIFRLSLKHGIYGSSAYGEKEMVIHVTGVSQSNSTVKVFPSDTIEILKYKISETLLKSLDTSDLSIFYAGKKLVDDNRMISDCDIQNESLIHVVFGSSSRPSYFYYVPQNSRDPRFDYDFTHVNDNGKHFYRGGKEYHRPCGWYRYALKVLGKYENDTWLGKPGKRYDSSDEEWPVSYHGTAVSNAGDITQEGYLLSKGIRFKFGKGIYSTPSIEVALKYAQCFKHEGKEYRIVFQNRVNTDGLKVIDGRTTGKGIYWVQSNENYIRPYGICIQQC